MSQLCHLSGEQFTSEVASGGLNFPHFLPFGVVPQLRPSHLSPLKLLFPDQFSAAAGSD